MNKKLITFVALATVLVATLYLTNDSTTLIKSHQASTGGRWMPTDTACNDACAKVGVVCGVQYNVCCQKDGNCADHSIKIPFVGEKHWKTCGTAVPDFKLITFVALAAVLVATLYLSTETTTLIKSHQKSTAGRWMPDDQDCNAACAKVGVVCGINYNVCCQKDGNCADHSIKIPFVGEKKWKTCDTSVPDFAC